MQRNATPARLTKSVLVGSTAMLLGMAVAGTAYAADAPAAAKPAAAPAQEVVVTGSRIQRRDFTSNSPIVTVNQQQFQNTANVAVEATLNKLPQFTPDQDLTGVNSADVQETATHTIGISTASLRGLGANRNLVLADGQRLQPINGSLVIDLNSIPTAIIDHVEVVTGGASAVYGADAVSGVVNFILKKNYQGLEIDAQYGVTQAGDGNEFKVSALFGTNFADDKGNVTFALEHYTRAPSWQKNRDYFLKGYGDRTSATNEFFNTGSYFFGPNNPPSSAALVSLFGAAPPGTNFGFFRFNPDGTLAAGAFGNPGLWGAPINFKPTIDGVHIANEDFVSPSGTIITGVKTNQVDDYFVTSPLSRWSMYGAAHYDFNENLQLYTRGTFVVTHTATNLFSTPFIGGWSANYAYNSVTDDPNSPGYIPSGHAGAQHPVPAQLATLLNHQLFSPFPASQWTSWLIPSTNGDSWMAPRSTVNDNTVWQVTAGLKGNAPIGDWTWDLYGSHGQASDYSQGNGYTSLQRFITVVTAPDYGRNQTFVGNTIFGHGSFGTASVHCTSGFYDTLFHGAKPSQDCINAINATTQSRVFEEQNIVEFDAQGTLFHLPAGDLKLSLGADYRDELVIYTPDILQSTASFIDQVAGVYPTSYEHANISAREGYGELLVPVLKDLPFMKELTLELGARYSTYTGTNNLSGQHITPPGGWTYKILADWRINDWARLRGGYNLSVRSPNAGELFLAKQEQFAGSTLYGDACSGRSNAPYGAGGTNFAGLGAGVDARVTTAGAPGSVQNPYPVANEGGAAGAANSLAICKALMDRGTGTSVGSTYYYTGQGGTAQPAPAPAPFGFENQLGNQNLKAEKAHTWTAGIVLSSPWQNPWVGNLHAAIDWYDIKVVGAIEFQAPDEVAANCLRLDGSTPAAAAAAATSPQCQLLNRIVGTGAGDTTTVQFTNNATIWTSGLDFQIDNGWNFEDVGLHGVPGRLQFNWLFNYLFNYDSQASHTHGFDQIYKWAGTLGPSLTGVDLGSAYKYKMNTTLTYMEGPFTLSLNWRFYPHSHSASYPLYQALPKNTVTGAVGLQHCGPGVFGNGANTPLADTGLNGCLLDTPAYHTFDLSGTYTIMRNYTLRFGVDNLFDKQPPSTTATTGLLRNTDGTYKAGGAIAIDGNGGFGSGTNTSIYDALGRRFYIGINAKF
jgi:outer membrane receptor protein involved in Fe transport